LASGRQKAAGLSAKSQAFQSVIWDSLARIVHSSIAKLSRASGGATRAYPTGPLLEPEMSYLKQKLSIPVVKYSALAIALCLWVFGLIDQLYSSAEMMKYLLLSILMAAIAFI
jgi:hypothetical protein